MPKKAPRLRLDQLLVERGFAENRSRAAALIEEGRVCVAGMPAGKAGMLCAADCTPTVRQEGPEWVSRGAHKLLKGLEAFAIDPTGKECLDIGASTGGFTDVLLSRGAARVFAVDVGYGQLAWKLRSDSRVVVMERTNARTLTPDMFPVLFPLIVTDASFISLRLLLPALETLLELGGDMVLLLKPQFEAGRERVGKKGVVRDAEVHRAVLDEFLAFLDTSAGSRAIGADFSPILGPEGNMEFLLHLVARDDLRPTIALDTAALVARAHDTFSMN